MLKGKRERIEDNWMKKERMVNGGWKVGRDS